MNRENCVTLSQDQTILIVRDYDLATTLSCGQAFRWTLGGLAAGLAGSALAAYSLRGLLFHVSALDPLAFGVAALVLVTLSVVAALVPSHRAASLDPMVVLRQE